MLFRSQLVAIDKQAVEPVGPIKPNKLLIVVLGAFLGVFLGTVIAVCRHFLQSRSSQDERSIAFSFPVVEGTLDHDNAERALLGAKR